LVSTVRLIDEPERGADTRRRDPMSPGINMSGATCAICGAGVHIDDHEGPVACDGCGKPIDN